MTIGEINIKYKIDLSYDYGIIGRFMSEQKIINDNIYAFGNVLEYVCSATEQPINVATMKYIFSELMIKN
jgi:hypothetical protein